MPGFNEEHSPDGWNHNSISLQSIPEELNVAVPASDTNLILHIRFPATSDEASHSQANDETEKIPSHDFQDNRDDDLILPSESLLSRIEADIRAKVESKLISLETAHAEAIAQKEKQNERTLAAFYNAHSLFIKAKADKGKLLAQEKKYLEMIESLKAEHEKETAIQQEHLQIEVEKAAQAQINAQNEKSALETRYMRQLNEARVAVKTAKADASNLEQVLREHQSKLSGLDQLYLQQIEGLKEEHQNEIATLQKRLDANANSFKFDEFAFSKPDDQSNNEKEVILQKLVKQERMLQDTLRKERGGLADDEAELKRLRARAALKNPSEPVYTERIMKKKK